MRSVESIFREIEQVPDFAVHTIDSVSYRNGYGDTALDIAVSLNNEDAIAILISVDTKNF